MQIGGKPIGTAEPPYFIAEAGVNHNGDCDLAEDLIDTAVKAGADAVKFQTFSAERLVSENTPTARYQQALTGIGDQRKILRQYELGLAEHRRLQAYCKQQDITFLSTPFDPQSADMLVDIGVPAIKLGSGELDNKPLLAQVADYGLPLIISTGMGTIEEVHSAHKTIKDVDSTVEIAFLHCTTSYPCDISDVHLRAMKRMDSELSTLVGYSDHTTLPEMPALAVAAGASIVEKHFTMDRSLPGPDHKASLEPDELQRAVSLVEMAASALGSDEKTPTATERELKDKTRKGLHAATDIPAGAQIQDEHVDVLRPATGLTPRRYDEVVGARAVTDIKSGEPITAIDVDSIKGDN
jgi:N-acetylneuraminate synthase/N,N'-diacetyllegionaminate synthase